METNDLLIPKQLNEEAHQELKLRPQNFDEFIGQKKIVQNIEIMVKSANLRNSGLDHILLSGPPGLGKTSLAMLIAGEMGTKLHVISGPAIEKKGDLAAILTNLAPKDVLFIDEIHRIHISIEEILYSAMEDFRLDILIGQGPSARTMQIDLNPFTLIGATTRSGLLSTPLRDRFMAHFHFDFYEDEEIFKILSNNSDKMNFKVMENALGEMSKRSRGTPRIANRILRRVRDYALVNHHELAEKNDVLGALDLLEIDSEGFDRLDRKILQTINEYYNGGPVGIEALCSTLGEERDTIEDVHEPYLVKKGFILRTPRGRALSEKSKNYLESKN